LPRLLCPKDHQNHACLQTPLFFHQCRHARFCGFLPSLKSFPCSFLPPLCARCSVGLGPSRSAPIRCFSFLFPSSSLLDRFPSFGFLLSLTACFQLPITSSFSIPAPIALFFFGPLCHEVTHKAARPPRFAVTFVCFTCWSSLSRRGVLAGIS